MKILILYRHAVVTCGVMEDVGWSLSVSHRRNFRAIHFVDPWSDCMVFNIIIFPRTKYGNRCVIIFVINRISPYIEDCSCQHVSLVVAHRHHMTPYRLQ